MACGWRGEPLILRVIPVLSPLLFVLSGCVASGLVDDPGTIREEDHGEDWIFTVPEVTLHCYANIMVWVEVDGYGYPLNGIAKTGLLAEKRPYLKGKIRDLEHIWRFDDEFNEEWKELTGENPRRRIDMGSIIEDGFERC